MDDYKELCELVLEQIKMQLPIDLNTPDLSNEPKKLVSISDMSDEQIKWALQNIFKDDTTYDSRVKSLIAMLKFMKQYDASNNTVPPH